LSFLIPLLRFLKLFERAHHKRGGRDDHDGEGEEGRNLKFAISPKLLNGTAVY
jgi:hypothetical protein